jgi:hypothetical protein
MPFVHLERELWDLRDAAGREITPDAPERRGWPARPFVNEARCDPLARVIGGLALEKVGRLRCQLFPRLAAGVLIR